MVDVNNMIFIRYELSIRLYQLNEIPVKIGTPDNTLQAYNIASHIDDEKNRKNFMETQQHLQNIINTYTNSPNDNIKKLNDILNNSVIVTNIVIYNLYKLFCENTKVIKKTK